MPQIQQLRNKGRSYEDQSWIVTKQTENILPWKKVIINCWHVIDQFHCRSRWLERCNDAISKFSVQGLNVGNSMWLPINWLLSKDTDVIKFSKAAVICEVQPQNMWKKIVIYRREISLGAKLPRKRLRPFQEGFFAMRNFFGEIFPGIFERSGSIKMAMYLSLYQGKLC